jgi:septal ring factor EnvC (AmiA/AmiB activator)
MLTEDRLREKLRKIEALYAGASTTGEKAAAEAAAERIRKQYQSAARNEKAEECKVSIPDHGRASSSSPCAVVTGYAHTAIRACTVRRSSFVHLPA